MYEENEKSIFNYNMLFNKINSDNLDEKIDYNTNLISDINLQNFDIKRYEYYTNLLYIYNKDPATLYNLLKKYYNIKNFKSKERKIIKYISNYARLLKNNPDPDDNKSSPPKDDKAGVATRVAGLESSGGGALGKYDALYTELEKETLNKIKRSDALNEKKGYVEKGSAFDIDVKDDDNNLEPQKEKLEILLKILQKKRSDDAAAPVAQANASDSAVALDVVAHPSATNIDTVVAAAGIGFPPATNNYLHPQHPAPPPPPIVAVSEQQQLKELVLNDLNVLNDAIYDDIPVSLDNNQDDNNSKKLTKIAIETLQRLQNKETQQPRSQVNFQDELTKLNLYFQVLNKYYNSSSSYHFKYTYDDPNHKIDVSLNLKYIRDIMVKEYSSNLNLNLLQILNVNLDNIIKDIRYHTNKIILGITNNDDIIIRYTNFEEFLEQLEKKINRLIKIFKNHIQEDILKKNKLYNIIYDLIKYLEAKKDDGYLGKLIYIKEKILEIILIIDKTKYYKILNDFNEVTDEKVLLVGGNLNDKLKIKYLDTRKYKDLKEKKDLDEYKDGKYHIEIDDDDDMNKIGQLSDDIDEYYNSTKDKKDKDKFIIQQINNFENDPKNPLEELAITFDDRIVFIIATFFIRYITIIMVQWCIDINIIKTFYEGFIYYAIIYIIIFWFIVLFINIDNSFDVKYMNFNGIINTIRTLFYYFYMGTNGITRLLIHTSLIILLIIIPIILNIKNNTEFKDENEDDDVKILNYDERKQLSKSLSLFTMFIWLFTSIIATKF